MNNLSLLSALHQTLLIIVYAVCIITLPTLIIGVIVSIVQAATQINEMTVTFIPKLIVMFAVLLTLTPWLLNKLVHVMQDFMFNLPVYIK
ncbi:MAG: flagellar biosynthetic protein FliQ [Legionellales bacterium]